MLTLIQKYRPRILISILLVLIHSATISWGFFGHRRINYYSVFLLAPQLMILYKPHIDFITDHAVDPDKRRYIIKEEGPRHYIDLDHYANIPISSLPRNWREANLKFGVDSLYAHGIVVWWIPVMLQRLTNAFKEKNTDRILKLSAELGHYIADAHVPLHASSNHNGQFTNQTGIHGFWESRVPELLADEEFDFLVGRAAYISNPSQFIWQRVLESARAADTVLKFEKMLSAQFTPDKKYSFELRNGILIRQYSTAFTTAYNNILNGMIERRMRQSIFAVASFWFTAWVNAGQPDLSHLNSTQISSEDAKEFEELNLLWKTGTIKGRSCDN